MSNKTQLSFSCPGRLHDQLVTYLQLAYGHEWDHIPVPRMKSKVLIWALEDYLDTHVSAGINLNTANSEENESIEIIMDSRGAAKIGPVPQQPTSSQSESDLPPALRAPKKDDGIPNTIDISELDRYYPPANSITELTEPTEPTKLTEPTLFERTMSEGTDSATDTEYPLNEDDAQLLDRLRQGGSIHGSLPKTTNKPTNQSDEPTGQSEQTET